MADRPPDLPTRRKKVKSGCRTCKVRRVKCDEGRPACSRCVSTGRICEGYGIWGGGSNGIQSAGRVAVSPRADPYSVVHALPASLGKLSPEQEKYFQWFKQRTFTKLPLPFITEFWRTLILQACAAEPAILHASLALGSAHQTESFEAGAHEGPDMALDSRQTFMLREYGRAMRSLQPHFSSHDKGSIRIALSVCILFTFLENLRGRYVAANAHLHSGLRLIAEHYSPVDRLVNGVVTSAKSRGYVDDWIIDTFVRLHVQAALLGQGLPNLLPELPVFPTTPIPKFFESAVQAAQHIDKLMLEILHLAERCSIAYSSVADPTLPLGYHETQSRLVEGLEQWLTAYNATTPANRGAFSPVGEFYIRVLRGYHTMAKILLNTCTWQASEEMYDLYTEDFNSLLERLVGIWKSHIARPVWHATPWTTGMPRKVSHSVGDKGWIPLLYFVAVKCRVHRIRTQAINLLKLTEHKEGIWDSRIAVLIAEEIVRLEEGDHYQGFEIDDKFNIMSVPSEQDLALPPLPGHRRLYNIRVELPDHSMGIMALEYEHRQGDRGTLERVRKCYDPRVARWVAAVR
ncbi:hypothetical protein F4861DRAFT_264971 [Xylaria intraflava]|nr:hypothetical protein F4861DRAFT_264971 [Xylaria intraflava]